jgi:lysophospholipid hydrolase
MIASRVRSEVDSSTRLRPTESPRSSNVNLKTVAVLPSSRHVPVEAFSRKLFAALESIGAPSFYLNQSSVSDHLGRHAFTRMGKLKAAGWLAEQEQKYRIVLYVADSPVTSSWTQTCIRQVRHIAVCLLILYSHSLTGRLCHGCGYGRRSFTWRIRTAAIIHENNC